MINLGSSGLGIPKESIEEMHSCQVCYKREFLLLNPIFLLIVF